MQLASRNSPGRSSGATGRRVAALSLAVCAALVLAACSSSSNASTGGNASDKTVGVSLILKTLTNPYFVSMEKDAKVAAAKDNVKLTVAAGKSDGDTQTQITAIDNAISRGDKGILITTNGDAVSGLDVADSFAVEWVVVI